ncbi:MAG: hypothetical protein P1U40_00935 [Coxiellaceae bacterium]|nr:hypothetical protein [Coxiellaceae bacterium]
MSRSHDELIAALLAKDIAEQQDYPSRESPIWDMDYNTHIPNLLQNAHIFLAVLLSGKDNSPYFFPADSTDSKYLLRAALLVAILNHFTSATNPLGAICHTLLTKANPVFDLMAKPSPSMSDKLSAKGKADRFIVALKECHAALKCMPPTQDIAALAKVLALTTHSCALKMGTSSLTASYQTTLDEISTNFQTLAVKPVTDAPAVEAKAADDEYEEPTPAPAVALPPEPRPAPAPAAEASSLWSAGAWVLSCAAHPLDTVTSMGSHMLGAVMRAPGPTTPTTLATPPAVVAAAAAAPPPPTAAAPSPPMREMAAYRVPEYISDLESSLGKYSFARTNIHENRLFKSNSLSRRTGNGFTRTTKLAAAHALTQILRGGDSILTKPDKNKTEIKMHTLYCKALLQKDSGLLTAVTQHLPEDIKSITENKLLSATDRIAALVDRIEQDRRRPDHAMVMAAAAPAPAPSI